MTAFQSPSAGFTSLSWEPPEGWELLEIRRRPGVHRLFTVAALTAQDKSYYTVEVKRSGWVNLRVQGLLERANGGIYHACGMINTRPGTGWHPYWAMLYFDERSGGGLAVKSDTVALLRRQ